MIDEYKVSVKITAEDIFNFMITHALGNKGNLATAIFGLVCLVLSPYFMIRKDLFIAVILLFSGCAFVIGIPITMYSNSKRQVLTNPVFKRKITFIINEEHVFINQYTGEVTMKWPQISRIHENRRSFMFYVNDQQALILPKRAFESVEILAAARELIQKCGIHTTGRLGTQEKKIWTSIQTNLKKLWNSIQTTLKQFWNTIQTALKKLKKSDKK